MMFLHILKNINTNAIEKAWSILMIVQSSEIFQACQIKWNRFVVWLYMESNFVAVSLILFNFSLLSLS